MQFQKQVIIFFDIFWGEASLLSPWTSGMAKDSGTMTCVICVMVSGFHAFIIIF